MARPPSLALTRPSTRLAKMKMSQTIPELRDKVAHGKLSAAALCEEYLRRLEARDPALRVMCDTTAQSARQAAASIDGSVGRGDSIGTLAGIPVAVKSNIDIASTVCSAGLPYLGSYRPTADADAVSRLRRAGAVIVGSVETDSGGFGVTSPDVFNPRFPDRITGGSSGGSAAAVAAGFCKVALGTDTGGSVRIPAACCGVLGFKPTLGRVSTQGVRPLASSIDHVGVLGLSAVDIQAVMEVIDPAFDQLPTKNPHRVPVLGIARDYLRDATPAVARHFEAWVSRCVDIGCKVREVELLHPQAILDAHLVLSLTDAALSQVEGSGVPLEMLPATAAEGVRIGLEYKAFQFLRAQGARRMFVDRLNQALSQVDVVALPTLQVMPPRRGSTTLRIGNTSHGILETLIRYTSPFNQSGHPAFALPWHMPLSREIASIQLVGPTNSDRILLQTAATLARRIEGFGVAAAV